jgi:hypothetical protein
MWPQLKVRAHRALVSCSICPAIRISSSEKNDGFSLRSARRRGFPGAHPVLDSPKKTVTKLRKIRTQVAEKVGAFRRKDEKPVSEILTGHVENPVIETGPWIETGTGDSTMTGMFFNPRGSASSSVSSRPALLQNLSTGCTQNRCDRRGRENVSLYFSVRREASLLTAAISFFPIRPSISLWTGASAARHASFSFSDSV